MQRFGFFLFPLFLLTSATAAEPAVPIFRSEARFHPVTAFHGMASTQEQHATQAAVEILESGGNAVDAAVCAGFVLSVTLPRAGALGGGGFMLVHLKEEGRVVALDYREIAPAAAHRDLFLGPDGEPSTELSQQSALASGVPGNVAGLTWALRKWGTMPLEDVMRPAIRLADEGFDVSVELHRSLLLAQSRLGKDPAARKVFYQADGTPLPIGYRLRQPDLAKTLRLIAEEGPDAFYEGAIAKRIAGYMKDQGGIITRADLANYRVVEREPVRGKYRGYTVCSMPPPSSGGVHLVQMLNILEPFRLRESGPFSARTVHTLAETMKLAYADRSLHLGDPDFVAVPVKGLVSLPYAETLRERIDRQQATPSREIAPGDPTVFQEGRNTTHFSIVDRHGNAVSNTFSINFSYGSNRMVPGTGMLLNNTMDDFSAKPGFPNAYGLIGGEANAIEPGKRMLSSMSPTIVLDPAGKTFLVTGSPGGSRIITTVLQVILNVLEHEMNIAEATAAPRVHHQWLPDQLEVERGISRDTISILEEMGHDVVVSPAMGSTQSIVVRDGMLYGASDPRRPDALTSGY